MDTVNPSWTDKEDTKWKKWQRFRRRDGTKILRGSRVDVCSMALACSSRPPAVSIGSKRVPGDPSRRLANQWKIFSLLSMSGKVYRSLPANGSTPDVVLWHGYLDV